MKYATRKFRKSCYEGDFNDLNDTKSNNECYSKDIVEAAETIVKELPKQYDNDKDIPKPANKSPSETEISVAKISDTGLLMNVKASKSESNIENVKVKNVKEPGPNMKDELTLEHELEIYINELLKLTIEQSMNTTVNFSNEMSLETERFQSFNKQVFKDIDKAYQQEMLGTEVKNYMGIALTYEKCPPDQTGSFSINVDDTYLDAFGQHDHTESDDVISDSSQSDTIVDKSPGGLNSDSGQSNAIIDSGTDVSTDSGQLDTIVYIDTRLDGSRSEISQSDAVVDNWSDDAMSDGDTFDGIDDIDTDEAILGIEDIDLVDEDVDDAARKDVDEFTEDNDIADDIDVTDDDGDVFGIINIYTESDLHFDLNKVSIIYLYINFPEIQSP